METKNFVVENGRERVLYYYSGLRGWKWTHTSGYHEFLTESINRLREVYPEYGRVALRDVLKRHPEGIYQDEIPEKIDNSLNKQMDYRNGYVKIDLKIEREYLSVLSHYNKNITISRSSDIVKVMQDILKYDDGDMDPTDFANLLYLCLCDAECKFDFVINGDGNETDLVINSVSLTKEFVSMCSVLGLGWVLSIIKGSDSGRGEFYNDWNPFIESNLPETIAYTFNEQTNCKNECMKIEVDRKKLSSFSRSQKKIYVQKSDNIEIVMKRILVHNYGEMKTKDFANLLYLCLCDVECKFDFVITNVGKKNYGEDNYVELTKDYIHVRGVADLDRVIRIIKGID